jgi:hypothetical protein
MATQTTGGTPSVDITHTLIAESGRISGEIYRRTIDTSPWLKLVKQDAWPNQMGDNLSVLTYERTLPPSPTWSNINSASNKYCIPDAVQVPVAQTMQTYGLAHTAIESDPICVHDVRFGYQFREQLSNIYDNLVENVAWMWKDRYREQYTDWAHHNVVAYEDTTGALCEAPGLLANTAGTVGAIAGKGMPEEDTANAAFTEANVSRLTQGILNRFYMQLIRDGGGSNPMGRTDGRPVFTLITSAEASDHIIRQNADGTRDDYRYSPNVNELLKPLGVERSHRGFFHVVDPFPKRYTYDGGQALGSRWTEVLPYVADATSYQGKQGSENRYIVNPAYETAEYEDSFIFHQDVFKSLIPTPLGNAGSNVQFNPLTYRGKYDFLNIKDRFDNPDGSWGYFRGVLANGAKPCKPQWGYVIRHKRCDAQFELLDCSDTAIT